MRILALETSTMDGSVAALEGEHLLGQLALEPGKRTAQSFAPAIEQQLRRVGWCPQNVQLVAVTQGPGSFTGLRIGVTAAKTLAYAVGASHRSEYAESHRLAGAAGGQPVCAVLDAQRQQVFAAAFQRQGEHFVELGEPEIRDVSEWLAGLSADAAVTGPVLARLRDRLPAGVTVVDPAYWTPQAATVGLVGYLEHQAGKRHDLWTLNPVYYRSSAAEEKVRKKEGP